MTEKMLPKRRQKDEYIYEKIEGFQAG